MINDRRRPSIIKDLTNLMVCGSLFAIVVMIFIAYTKEPEKPTLADIHAHQSSLVFWSWAKTILGISVGLIIVAISIAMAFSALAWGLRKWSERSHIKPDANGNLPVVPFDYEGHDEWSRPVKYRVFTDLQKTDASVIKHAMNGRVETESFGHNTDLAQTVTQARQKAASEAKQAKNTFINGTSKTRNRAPNKAELHYAVDDQIKREQVRAIKLRNDERQRQIEQKDQPMIEDVVLKLPRLTYGQATKPHRGHGEIVLGQNVDNGEKAIWNLSVDPHYRVVGSSGSGKSMMAQSIVAQMIASKIEVIILDIERADFDDFSGHAQLIDTNDPNVFYESLAEIWNYYNRRMDIIRNNHTGTQANFNNITISMNRVFIVIDEFTAQMMNGSDIDHLPNLLDDIAARIRKAGMHMMIVDQRPMADVMSGRLRNNFRNYLVGNMPEDSHTPIKAKRPLNDYEFNWSGGGIITGWNITSVLESIPESSTSPRYIDVSRAIEHSQFVDEINSDSTLSELDKRIAAELRNTNQTNQEIADLIGCSKRKVQLVNKDLGIR